MLVRDTKAFRRGEDSQHRNTGSFLEKAKTGFEQGRITAELVDQESIDTLAFGGRQQFNRADQSCENAALVDVSNQQNRRIRQLGNRPVNQVAMPQIHFRGPAAAFDYDQIEVLPKALLA